MSSHILFFEPRTEGHHLMFLHHVVEGLLEANYRLTLAIDLRTETARKILREKNCFPETYFFGPEYK